MLLKDKLGRALRGQTIDKRFWAKVDKSGDCWLWTAAKNNRGYGMFSLGRGRLVLAHRFAYELTKGAIPDGLSLDHLCRVPACVNPNHTEPVTHQVNVRRGMTSVRTKERCAAITHCPQGHAYDEANTFTDRGARSCRRCNLDRSLVYQARKRVARIEGQKNRMCLTCGATIPDGRSSKMYCSVRCKKTAYRPIENMKARERKRREKAKQPASNQAPAGCHEPSNP